MPGVELFPKVWVMPVETEAPEPGVWVVKVPEPVLIPSEVVTVNPGTVTEELVSPSEVEAAEPLLRTEVPVENPVVSVAVHWETT